jgi:hypothetical protein
VNSGSIDKYHLAGGPTLLFLDVKNSQYAVASGLGLGTDDRELLADQRIQQGRFPRVRAAENADET